MSVGNRWLPQITATAHMNSQPLLPNDFRGTLGVPVFGRSLPRKPDREAVRLHNFQKAQESKRHPNS